MSKSSKLLHFLKHFIHTNVFLETLSIYYPPVSEDKDHYESIYIRKGESATLSCAMKHLGFPKVTSENYFRVKLKEKEF